jgi:succinate dehydrogenase / fumarate reductase membrane anchor subunit
MVTAVTSLTRTGLSDWLVQRVSAAILLAYFLFIAYTLLSGVDYAQWSGLFAQTWMKVFTLLALLAIAAHAWIGMWAVLTDYVTERLMGPKGNVLRITLQLLLSLALVTYVVWGVQLIW